MKEAIDHAPAQPQTPRQKLRSNAAPCSECTTSGWNWMPKSGRSPICTAAYSVLSVTANVRVPGGVASTLSPWLIHIVERAGRPAKSGHAASATRSSARPYSRAWPGPTRPPSSCTISCIP